MRPTVREREIEIGQSSAEPEEKGRSAATFWFLTAGVLGMLCFLDCVAGISFSGWAVYPTAAVLCGFTWYICHCRRLVFALCAVGYAAVCGVAALWMGDRLREQFWYMAGCIAGRYNVRVMPVTEAAVFLAALLSFAVAVSEFLLKGHEVLCLLTMLALLFLPLLGIRANGITLLLLCLFQVTFLVAQRVHLAYGRKHLEGGSKRRLSGKSGVAAGMLFIVVFFAVFPPTFHFRRYIYAYVYEVEGQLRRTALRASGRAAEPVTGGKIRNGNSYLTGTAQLEIEASSKPKGMLYLKGFSGGDYLGGDWKEADDEQLYENIVEKLDWQKWIDLMSNRCSVMYYLMNENMRRETPVRSVSLNIRHYAGASDNVYVPYYSMRSRRYSRDEWEDMWRDYGYGDPKEGYVYRYYEQQDMNIEWENVRTNFIPERDWFLTFQEAYMKEIRTAYTTVPQGILPRLTELCRGNPMGSREEVTSFILHTLHDNTVYTLTPGWAPLNKDIVEYFLFESGGGYCQHYAATATLMYRLYGIPARYATGYVVSPDEFEQKDGSWVAVVTDTSAHAWVEIYLENYGWTPVEVTPDENGGSAAAYPGFDSAVFRQIAQERGWNREIDREALRQDSEEHLSGETEGISASEPSATFEKWFWSLGVCVLYSLFLMPFFLDYRRLKHLRELEMAGCRRIFSKLLQMLQYAEVLAGCDGTEEGFARELAQKLSLPEEDVKRLQDIVSLAAYGDEPPTLEEESFVWKMYERCAERVYKTLKRQTRILFRYWKTYY